MVVAVELLHQVTRTVGIVRTVPDLAVAVLEAAGKRNDRDRRDRVAHERFGRLARAADANLPPGHEVRVRVVWKHDDGVFGCNRELLGRDRLERVAEHLGVLEPDVREQHDTRTKDVRRVVASAEPRLDHRDVDARCPRRRRAPLP